MTSYINAELDLYVDVSTTDKNITLGKFRYVFSDTLNEDFKNPFDCRALSMYEIDDKRMHAYYILDNYRIRKKYFIFDRPVDNHFPLFISYYCIVHGYIENSSGSTSSTFSTLIIIIIVFIFLVGICYCFKAMCKSRTSSSTYTPSYRGILLLWEN